MPVRHALPLLVLALLWLLSPLRAPAQTMVMYNVDPSGFPTIRANVVVFDGTGARVPDLRAQDFEILEDGMPVTDITVTCPPVTVDEPFVAVLVNDRSGSMVMRSGSRTRMELVKAGASAFVNLVDFSPPTAVAITSFNETVEILSDFRQSRPPLLAAIASMTAEGGTLYDPPFLDPLAGAIGMLAGQPNVRRIVVFLTDGMPNRRPSTDAIISAALAANVEVYAITVGMPMNGDLATIAFRTGGITFANVTTEEQIKAIYSEILMNARGVEPCTITWKSRARCGLNDRLRRVGVTHTGTGATAQFSYEAPDRSVIGFEADPEYLYFGTVTISDSADGQVVITARNDTMRVDRGEITPTGPFRVVDWGGTPPPFVLAPDESRTVTVRFLPSDSARSIASLVLFGSPCPPWPITLTGGAGHDDGSGLRLLSPVGAEVFAGCDSVTIKWAGVAPDQPVDVDHSADDGATWRPVARGATGLSLRWMPPGPGRLYRVRVTATLIRRNIISTVAGGGLNDRDSVLATDALLYAPTGVEVADDTLYIAEAGSHRVRRVDLTSGVITTVAGTGNPGYNGEILAVNARLNSPMHVELVGNYLFIADQGNHRVRGVNVFDGRITTVAGTGASGFSGDGGPATGAMLRFPSWLAALGARLFVTDAGNDRIRAIDLSSGEITTVAGGGTNPAQLIPATEALLVEPAGIAVGGGYLYIAEPSSSRVRRVELATGLIDIVAGTGYPGVSGDGGAATAAMLRAPVGVHVVGAQLFIADSGAHQVRVVNLTTGIITTLAGTSAPGFAGDGSDAELARLDHPQQPAYGDGLLYVPDVRNNRVRAVSIGRGPATDSSRAPFSVDVARLAIEGVQGRRLSLLPVALGAVRDSAVAGVICNRGTAPLVVDSVRIVGAHPGDFEVVSGIPTAEIAPGTCEPFEVRFRPNALGVRTASIIMMGRCANADTLLVEGTGSAPCGFEVANLVSFDTVIVGSAPRDTMLTTAICNTGTAPIGGTVRLSSGAPVFEILEGAGTFTLGPGECRTLRVRFAPTVSGRVTGRIDFGLPSTCGPALTRLFGIGSGAPELSAPDSLVWSAALCVAAPRDTALALHNPGGASLIISSIDLVQTGSAFALLDAPPTAAAPLVIPPDSTGEVRVRFAPALPGFYTARLEIGSNTVPSPRAVALAGRFDDVLVELDGPVAVIGPDRTATYPRDTALTIHNRGTIEARIVDAQLRGPDAASFAVPPGQLPLTVPAGGSSSLTVRLLVAAASRALHADLELTTDPTCDSGRVWLEIIAPGDAPALAVAPPVFRDLVCPDETQRDTTILLQNAGGNPLTVSGATIRTDAESSFRFTPALPLTIAPGGSLPLVITFAPPTPGLKTAVLELVSDDPSSPHVVALRGVRERVALVAAPAALSLGVVVPGGSVDASTVLTNAGTVTRTVELRLVVGDVEIVGATVRTLGAGSSESLVIRYSPEYAGSVRDTLIVWDPVCGELARVPIEGRSAAPPLTLARLPVASARPGEHVSLPITLTVLDQTAFAESGARRCTVTVEFLGTVLVPTRVDGATLLSSDYSMRARMQTMVIEIDYDRAAPPSPSIEATAILGDTVGTPLRFVDVQWDSPAVGTETVDGFFTTIGNCFVNGLHIVSRPVILKVRPTPARTEAVVDLELEEWATLSVTLVDATGRAVLRRDGLLLEAGRHALPLDISTLPAGVYHLIVSSPFGADESRVLVE